LIDTASGDYVDPWYTIDGGATWIHISDYSLGGNWGGWWYQGAYYLGPDAAVEDFQIAFSLEDDLASGTAPGYYIDDITIYAGPAWKHEDHYGSWADYYGWLWPNESTDVEVTLDSTMVAGPGTYTADLWVIGGDPDPIWEDYFGYMIPDPFNPAESVSVTLEVLPNPDQAYVYGTVYGNRHPDGPNTPLPGAMVEFFGPPIDPLNDPLGPAYYFVTYTDENGDYEMFIPPWALGDYVAKASAAGYLFEDRDLSIEAQAYINQDFVLRLFAPILDVDPEVIDETLYWGETTVVPMTVANPNPSGDTLHAFIGEIWGTFTPPVVETVQVEIPAFTPSVVEVAGAMSDGEAAATPARTIDVEINNLALGQIDVLIFSHDITALGTYAVATLYNSLSAFPDLNVFLYEGSANPPLEDMLPYDVVIYATGYTWSNFDPDETGDMFADYIEAGGRVIMAHHGFMDPSASPGFEWKLGGRFQDEYAPIEYADYALRMAGPHYLGLYNAGHPIMLGVDNVEDYNNIYTAIAPKPGAEVVAYWDSGDYYVVTNEYVTAINQRLGNGTNWTGDTAQLVHNSIVFLVNTGDVYWLDASVTEFTLPIQTTANTDITLDADVVPQPGTYTAWLWFTHDDPDQIGSYVPVTMEVLPNANDGNVEGTVYLNRSPAGLNVPADGASVVVTSTVGSAEVYANVDGEYTYYYRAAELLPSGLDVILTASSWGYQTEQVTVPVNSGATTTQDFTLEFLAPWINVDPMELAVELNSGETTTMTLDVENLGLWTLIVPEIEEVAPALLETHYDDSFETKWVSDDFSVDAAVDRSLLKESSTTDFFIWMRERADLSPAYEMQDKAARGQFVYDALTSVAQSSQADVLKYLDARGIEYTSYWINNSILVKGADRAVIDAMSARGDVVRIRSVEVRMYVPEAETLEMVTMAPNSLASDPTWNTEIVSATETWDMGVTGAGVVVANIDTGVEYEHEALLPTYRGNLGYGIFDHNYNWFAPSVDGQGQCGGAAATEPCDHNDHGTHTMGTMVGGDGNGPFDLDIGMAPDAQWIACMGCDSGRGCSDEALTGCAEWIVAPTDLTGANPDPAMAPDVVNNSWGGSGEDDWYYSYVEAWNAANIIPVFSAGNSGPGCSTLGSPGSMANVINVGGTDINDFNYASTSRGPGSGNGVFPVVKPVVAAPGESVPSSVTGNGYAYFSGTSMAAPHVSGLVALLRQVDPNIDFDGVWTILTQNAVTDTLDIKNGTWCGYGPAFPNCVFGYGRIDAYASVNALMYGTDVPWLGVTPMDGYIDPVATGLNADTYMGTMEVEVTFDATGLDQGVYEAFLRVIHNDPLTGEILIPVTLTVEGYTEYHVYLPMIPQDVPKLPSN
jgi:subtilisin family serine protease